MPVMAKLVDAIPIVTNTAERALVYAQPDIYQRVHNLQTAKVEMWNGGIWIDVGWGAGGGGGGSSFAVVASTAARNAAFPSPAADQLVLNKQTGHIERYDTVLGWVIDIQRHSNVSNPFSFGAKADGGATTITAGDITAHPEWIGRPDGTPYVAGVDTWDYVALQEAVYYANASASTPGNPVWNSSGSGARLNRPLLIPKGNYGVNRAVFQKRVVGGILRGAGKYATEISALGPHSTWQTDGYSFNVVEDISFTNLGPTQGQDWVPNTVYAQGVKIIAWGNWNGTMTQDGRGMTYVATTGGTSGAAPGPVWRSDIPVVDNTVTWTPQPEISVFDMSWVVPSPGYSAALQGNTFKAVAFNCNGRGIQVGTRVGGGDSTMGSENIWINCHWMWFTLAGVRLNGAYALQNTFIGGNISSCPLWGIFSDGGSFQVFSMGFQNGVYDQWKRGGYDCRATRPAMSYILLSQLRSESCQLYLGEGTAEGRLIDCVVTPGTSFWYANAALLEGYWHHDGLGRIWFKNHQGGLTGATIPAFDAAANGATIVDNTVTWIQVAPNAWRASTVSVDRCGFHYGVPNVNVDAGMRISIKDSYFSRADWFTAGQLNQQAGHIAIYIRNVSVHPAGGPENGGAVKYRLASDVEPDYSHMDLGSQWLWFSRGRLNLGYFPTVGIGPADYLPRSYDTSDGGIPDWQGDTRADNARDVLGVQGKVGKRAKKGSNLAGLDAHIAGGQGTGSGIGGKIRFQVAPPAGLGATIVNALVDGFVLHEDKRLQLMAGHQLPTRTVSADATALVTDYMIRVDTTGASRTITLPPAASYPGMVLYVKKIAAANTCTVDGNAAETIDGALTLAWTTQYQGYLLQSNGTGWDIL